MRSVEVRPIPEKESDYDQIEKEIDRIFREEIYYPLLRELKEPNKILNSANDLNGPILSSRVVYENGKFTGKFGSKFSKEMHRLGAKFNKRDGSWEIPIHKLSASTRAAIRESEDRFKKILKKIDRKLAGMLPDQVAQNVRLTELFDRQIFRVNREVNDSLKKIAVPVKLSDREAKKIAEEYTQNLQLYIKDFTEKEIVQLRKEMQQKVFRGTRYEDAVKIIEKSYGVSRRKAKFLARQETSLLMTSFKTERYKSAGIKKYRWRCVAGSKNHPVRPMHKIHDGKIFEYDKPPVTDEKGNRNNPGRDFNCRCIDVPIVEFL